MSVASIASSASTAGGRSFPEKLMVSQVLVNVAPWRERYACIHDFSFFLRSTQYSVVFIYILYVSLFTLDISHSISSSLVLQDMIQTATSDRDSSTYSASIHWMPHGKSFAITDPDAFSADVLPRYFKSTKFKSFTRKLYRWGFRQITKGPDKGSYYHELFVRDDPGLCGRMNCGYSDKELKTQADNAAKRRGSYGSVERPTGRRNSGARDALASATGRLTLGLGGGGGAGGEDDDEMAILRAAAVFGGSGSRSSLGGSKGRSSLSGRLSGAGGRRGSGSQFQQAQRRVSATRRQSAGSAVSGLGFDDDDDDESESMSDAVGAGAAGVPASINVGGSTDAAPRHQPVDASIAAQSSSAVTAAVAVAQAQAAAQYSAMTGSVSSAGGGSAMPSKTAEEILAQHRIEDAILAQQETAIRERRQQLQREQEERLKSLDLMAAAKAQGGGVLDAETVAKIKQMQEEMRVAQLQKEEVDRLKVLELAKAAGPQAIVGNEYISGAASVPTETTIPSKPEHPTALDMLAAAANETGGMATNDQATCQYKTAADIEQELLADAMKKYQEQG